MEFIYGLFNLDASGRDCNALRFPLQKPIVARTVGQDVPHCTGIPTYNCQNHKGPVLSQINPTMFLLLQCSQDLIPLTNSIRSFSVGLLYNLMHSFPHVSALHNALSRCT